MQANHNRTKQTQTKGEKPKTRHKKQMQKQTTCSHTKKSHKNT